MGKIGIGEPVRLVIQRKRRVRSRREELNRADLRDGLLDVVAAPKPMKQMRKRPGRIAGVVYRERGVIIVPVTRDQLETDGGRNVAPRNDLRLAGGRAWGSDPVYFRVTCRNERTVVPRRGTALRTPANALDPDLKAIDASLIQRRRERISECSQAVTASLSRSHDGWPFANIQCHALLTVTTMSMSALLHLYRG